MKTGNYVVALALVLTACCGAVAAQNKQNGKNKQGAAGGASYKTGVGLRLGYESGLTVKHFLGQNAVEGILSRGWGYGGFRITGLYEFQRHIGSVAGLDWFAGLGAHIGFYNGGYYGYRGVGNGYYDKHGNWHPDGYRRRYMTLGIDGILGLEYTFADVPLSLSLDIKPYIDLVGWGDHFSDGALSVRYTIR